MKLYYSPTSPFVRKVTACLIETGLHDRVDRIMAVGNAIKTGSLPIDVNPLGRVPCLVTDDGEAIYDSRIITRYLDYLTDGRLYPDQPRLWRTLTLEATADGIMEATLLIAWEHLLRPPETVFDDWIEAQWSKIERTLVAIEGEWMDHLRGPLDMAQIAVAVALGYLDLRVDDRNWRALHPELADWFAEFSERESLRATVPQA